jgi:hypothetical protein
MNSEVKVKYIISKNSGLYRFNEIERRGAETAEKNLKREKSKERERKREREREREEKTDNKELQYTLKCLLSATQRLCVQK